MAITGNSPAAGQWDRRDVAMAIVIALVTATVATDAVNRYRAAGYKPQFYQQLFAPAVAFACGQGFRNVNAGLNIAFETPQPGTAVRIERLASFLSDGQQTFDCRDLPADAAELPVNIFQLAHRYLMLLCGLVWRVTGVSWPALRLVSGMLAGLTGGLLFLFFRAGMHRGVAVAATCVAVLSPLHLSHVPHLRDYAKAPFFACMLLAMALVLRRGSGRPWTMAVMAAAGATLGIGFGMRTDVVLYLPLVLVALLVIRPGFDRRELLTKGCSAAAAIVSFVIVAAPIARGYQSGDNFAHVGMLGLTDSSRDWLRLNAPDYSFGYRYDDGYQATKIVAFADQRAELAAPFVLTSPEYATWGNRLYREILWTFPADILVRAWAAVFRVFSLPTERYDLGVSAWAGPVLRTALTARDWVLSPFGAIDSAVWLVAFVVAVAVVDLPVAILIGLVVIVFPGLVSVQFQGRHVFHLEFLPYFMWGTTVAWVWSAVRRAHWPVADWRAIAIRTAACVVTIAVVLVAPLAAARRYQVTQVGGLLDAYATAPRQPLLQAPVSLPSGVTRLPIILPPLSRAHFIDTHVLNVRVGSEACDSDMVTLTFRYLARPPFTDLTDSVSLVVPQAPAILQHVFPVFTPGRRSATPDGFAFTGVDIASSETACVAGIDAYTTPEHLPLALEATIRPDRTRRQLYETLREFEPSAADSFDSYAIPDTVRAGRRWLATLQLVHATPSYRSDQVRELTPTRIESDGRAGHDGAYLVNWPYVEQPAGAAWFVEGEIRDGGLTIGLQQDERWVHQINVDRAGRFRAVIRIDRPGRYGSILANHQAGGRHHSVITRYGWLPPLPAP